MPDPKSFSASNPLPATRDELIAEQLAVAQLQPPQWEPENSRLCIAGSFVAFPRGLEGAGKRGDRLWAAVAVLVGRRVIEAVVHSGEAGSAYEAGLLFLREGAALLAAFSQLSTKPDVALVNGTGLDHPRNAGLALHLGARLGLPTIGVTHRSLLARGDWPEDREGVTAPLFLEDRVVGYWLRVRRGTRPLAVHAAWRTTPATAVEVVERAVHRARTPEPIRIAREAARRARHREV